MIKKLNFLKYNLYDNNILTENKNINLLTEQLTSLEYEFILNKNKSSLNIIENFVNNIFLFHSNRLNLDRDKFYVTFSLENNDKFHMNYFHMNYFKYEDSKERINPICTTLTYLNNSLNPVVITDLDFEDYKYKNFKNSTNLLFSFPYKFEHICFDGKYYYGIPNIYEDKNIKPLILKVNIWDKKPNNINYYETEKFVNKLDNIDIDIDDSIKNINLIFEESSFHRQLLLDKNIINKNFLEEILYAKNNYLFIKLKDIFDNIENYYTIEENIKINKKLEHSLPVEVNIYDCNNLLIVQTENLPIIQNKTFNELINKYGNIIYDLYPIYYKKELKNVNRFYNYDLFKNYFTIDICIWMLNQINIFIKKERIHKTSLIKVEHFKNIFDFCIIVIENIYNKLYKIYGLNDIKIDIKNINILYVNKDMKNINDEIIEHIKKNNAFLLGIFKLDNISINLNENINISTGDLLLINTLRIDEIDLFKNKDDNNENYYLIYEINLNLSL